MTSEPKRCLESAITSAIDYLLTAQGHDGSWVDWMLPPGPSYVWTTAFVGYKLSFLPAHLKERAQRSTRKGSKWILKRMRGDNGWGYNDAVGSDADTTALAILFLSSTGNPVPDGCSRL